MKKFKFTISGNQYEVEVQSFENDKAQVVVNGTQYEVDVEREKEEAKPVIAPRPKAAPASSAAPAAPAAGDANGVKAVAPLPGTIMQIFVTMHPSRSEERTSPTTSRANARYRRDSQRTSSSHTEPACRRSFRA